LTVFPKRKNPIYGKFKGSLLDDPSDTFDVEVFVDPVKGEGIHTVNINKGCYPESIPGFSIGLSVRQTYKRFVFGDSEAFNIGPCLDPRGWYTVSEDGRSLRVDYTISVDDEQDQSRKHQVFIGRLVE